MLLIELQQNNKIHLRRIVIGTYYMFKYSIEIETLIKY